MHGCKGNRRDQKVKLVETGELPFVSVVICTYDRHKLLKDCLDSIFAIEYPKSLYEIIIVDGGSNDGTDELCKRFPEIRFVVERRFGLAYARNKGAEMARGSVVAYTDDDCVVDRHWLSNLISAFRLSQNVAGVGGPVYPLHPESIPKKILVKAALGLFEDGEKIKLASGVITSNSAFIRTIFETIKFDESLGTTRRGKLILTGEDTDFCTSLIDSGHKLLYTPYAKVYHQVGRKRKTVRYILKHAIHSGISTTRFILKKKNSRIWAVRVALGMLAQRCIAMISDRSFTSCYGIVLSLSTLLISVTGLDRILL
jgi:glycosyltransferase involved in cell wall biosynthesis